MYSDLLPFLPFLIAFLLWCWKVVNWMWIQPHRMETSLRAQGFTGNPYRLLFGDTKDMAAMIRLAKSTPMNPMSNNILPRVLPLHHHIVQKYDAAGIIWASCKASFIWIGPMARVLTMEPHLIKEILENNTVFKKPTPNPLVKYLVSGISGYEDDKWAKHRKIINPAFYLEKLKHMVPAMHNSCNEMVNRWGDELEQGRIEIDVHPYFEELSCEIISQTTFGSRNDEGRRILRLQAELAELTRQVLQSVYIPGWRYIPTKRNRRLKEINGQLCTILRGIIKQRERAINIGEFKDDDLLGILLKSNQNEIQENGSISGMNIDEVIEECKIFYFSGQESTTNLLAWTMVLLSIHTTWQDRARQEIFQVFANGELHFDGLSRLKTVTNILHEILRLYPQSVIFNRTIYKDTKLGDDITLPAGIHLLLPIILMHHDRDLWGDDVHEFNPERFSQGIAKATNNRLCYFPFSWGPRICIGNNFALLQAKVALVMMLRRFAFQLSPSYTHAPSYGVTLQPQFGVQLLLTRIQR